MANSLSPQLFSILSALIEERVGIHYEPEDAPLLGERIAGRMHEAGFESALDYYYFLRYDDVGKVEMGALVDALVVCETYFFRELESLEAGIERAIVPAIEREGGARVWCAACATGEEALSLAMLLDSRGLRDRTKILATDVSGRALARAREGLFGARALRALTQGSLTGAAGVRALGAADRWMRRTDTGAKVAPELVAGITWQRHNLLDDAAAFGTFDLVLCRNVLIYFADDTVRTVIQNLHRALAPDGRLVVGVAESLLRFGTMLTCEERHGAFLYGRSDR